MSNLSMNFSSYIFQNTHKYFNSHCLMILMTNIFLKTLMFRSNPSPFGNHIKNNHHVPEVLSALECGTPSWFCP